MKRFGLICVLLIASALRLWQLGAVPPSPDWDEAALGYNAYSILKTGKDEYGTRFPLSLRSYDDYKPPLYMYLTVPSVALFGLHTWSVRLPSAVAGVFAVLGVFYLVRELLSIVKGKNNERYIQSLSLIAAFLLAISPWHVQFSRIAFEANIGVTLNIWAVALFFRCLRLRKNLWISAVLFGLGMYAYHSERIFLPLLVALLAVSTYKELIKQKTNVAMFILVGLLTVLPLLPVFFTSSTLTRLRGTSSLADQTGLLRRSVAKLEHDRLLNDRFGMIVENRRIVWAATIFSGYVSHYSPKWLFLTGDNARHHAPDMGLLYLWELPFLLWGMLAVSKKGGALAMILWGWFFIAPIAASPTTELPHAIRTLVFLPVFQIFTAFGITEALYKFGNSNKNIWKKLLGLGYGVFVIAGIAYYLHMYFVHTNLEYSKYWQYGYKEAVQYSLRVKDKYQKIVISTDLEQPHMFFLFFLKYDPVKYLEDGGTASGGFAEVRNRFDIYEFRPIDWEKETHDGTVLYIGTPLEIPEPIETIDYLDGTEAIRIGDR